MMKYITLISLLITFSASAQKLTPYFGLNASSHWIDDSNSDTHYAYSSRSGFQGGLGYSHKLNELLSVNYRLEYTQKGYEGRNNTLHYLGLQQHLQITPLPSKLPDAYLSLGIANQRLVKKHLANVIIDHNETEEIISGNYEKWSFGGVAAVGYWIDRLNLEAGMNFDIAPSITQDPYEVRNYLWYFNVGFQVF
ncbi:MAG: hypothetical protein CMP48_27745 [Rickettsiales bacterium]|nr:hypothetical protein [Rickettsiales bacterium]